MAYQDRLEERNHWSNLSQSCIAIFLFAVASKILDLSLGFSPIIWLVFLPGSSNHLRLRWWLRISRTKLIIFDVAIVMKWRVCKILWDLHTQKGTSHPPLPRGSFLTQFFIRHCFFFFLGVASQQKGYYHSTWTKGDIKHQRFGKYSYSSTCHHDTIKDEQFQHVALATNVK